MNSAEVKKYWEERGLKYEGAPNDDEYAFLASLVGYHTNPGGMIAEIGSGWGRVYMQLDKSGLLNESRVFRMFDFVKSMRDVCEQKTGSRPTAWNGKYIPARTDLYDFVISASVLLHVPPEDIEQVFAEHVRITRRYLYVATYTGQQKYLAKHCFWHDYEQLFDNHQLKIVDQREYPSRTNWLLEK
ncbi:hypothetical protein LCGC14_0569460 [marine sediment metagenome]|uniref:Methyltransferase type 11 domain-containing protein n=1 Tax=marine sediment metagenome TaxID=412755 RepID=A0A0F9S386_9ZZZZ